MKESSACNVSRILSGDESQQNKKIVITLRMPYEVEEDKWCCEIEIKADRQWNQNIYGLDAFQCLFLAFDVLRKEIQKNYKSYHWKGANKDHGFSLIVPYFFNTKPVINNIEILIDNALSDVDTFKD